MNDTALRLTEYEVKRTRLPAIDRDYLAARFGSRIGVRQELVDGEILDVIDPGPNVGVVTLPSGRRLECSPKIEAANVFYMLSVAYELPDFLPERAAFDDLRHVFEFVVQHSADLTEDRIRHGLYRSYLERQDNLSRLRGRIVFSRDVPLNFAQRHHVYCEFSELSWDVPENQVVRQVAAQFSNWPFRRQLLSQLTDIDAVMADVSPTSHTTGVLDQISYNRLNEDYRPLHNLCRILMEYTSLHEEEGMIEFPAFLIDMNKLFEIFVTKLLAQELGPPVTVRGQRTTHLGYGDKVRMVPDVTIDRNGKREGILDTKYKKLGSEEFRNSDIYQVLAYCVAQHCPRGLLVYPLHLTEIDDRVEVCNSPIGINQLSIPLGGSLPKLKTNLDEFVDKVREWAR